MTNEQKLREALLPCPFCGDEAAESQGYRADGSPWLYIECLGCGGSAEPEMWNRRSLQPSDEGTPLSQELIHGETPITDAEEARLLKLCETQGAHPGPVHGFAKVSRQLERTLHAKERELAAAQHERDEWMRKVVYQESVSAAPQELDGSVFVQDYASNTATLPAAPQEGKADEVTEEMIEAGGEALFATIEAIKAKYDTPRYKEAGLTYKGEAPAEWLPQVYLAMRAVAPPATPRGDGETELPGMWDKSDLIGGETDCAEPDELPGALALQLAVQRGDWPHTMDASIWAEKFAEAVAADPTMTSDRGTMIGWFANAIMAGYDTAAQRLAATPPAANGFVRVPKGWNLEVNSDEDSTILIVTHTDGPGAVFECDTGQARADVLLRLKADLAAATQSGKKEDGGE